MSRPYSQLKPIPETPPGPSQTITLVMNPSTVLNMPWASNSVADRFTNTVGELHSNGVSIIQGPGGYTLSKGEYSIFLPMHNIKCVITKQ